jgi:hypothetical protein
MVPTEVRAAPHAGRGLTGIAAAHAAGKDVQAILDHLGRLSSGANLRFAIAPYPKRTGIHALFAAQSPP